MDIKRDDTPITEEPREMNMSDVYAGLKAAVPDGVYYTASVTASRYSSGRDEIEFGIYIEDLGHYTADSWHNVYIMAINAYCVKRPLPTERNLKLATAGLENIHE